MSSIQSYNTLPPQANITALPSDRDIQHRKVMPVSSFGNRHVNPDFKNPLAQKVEEVNRESKMGFPYLSLPSGTKRRSKTGVNSGRKFEELKARIKREASLRENSVDEKVILDQVFDKGRAPLGYPALTPITYANIKNIKKTVVDLAVNKKRMDDAIDFIYGLKRPNRKSHSFYLETVFFFEYLLRIILRQYPDGVSSAAFAKLLESASNSRLDFRPFTQRFSIANEAYMIYWLIIKKVPKFFFKNPDFRKALESYMKTNLTCKKRKNVILALLRKYQNVGLKDSSKNIYQRIFGEEANCTNESTKGPSTQESTKRTERLRSSEPAVSTAPTTESVESEQKSYVWHVIGGIMGFLGLSGLVSGSIWGVRRAIRKKQDLAEPAVEAKLL